MSTPLTAAEVDLAIKDLPGWELVDGRLVRTHTYDSFDLAISAVNAIAAIAEEHNHHPDIDIRWRTVTLRLSTHDADGAITDLDVRVARAITAV